MAGAAGGLAGGPGGGRAGRAGLGSAAFQEHRAPPPAPFHVSRGGSWSLCSRPLPKVAKRLLSLAVVPTFQLALEWATGAPQSHGGQGVQLRRRTCCSCRGTGEAGVLCELPFLPTGGASLPSPKPFPRPSDGPDGTAAGAVWRGLGSPGPAAQRAWTDTLPSALVSPGLLNATHNRNRCPGLSSRLGHLGGQLSVPGLTTSHHKWRGSERWARIPQVPEAGSLRRKCWWASSSRMPRNPPVPTPERGQCQAVPACEGHSAVFTRLLLPGLSVVCHWIQGHPDPAGPAKTLLPNTNTLGLWGAQI